MRTDMQRVIVERPRRKYRLEYCRDKIGLHQLDEHGDLIEDRPTRIGLRKFNRIYGSGDLKRRTDLLNPLCRYLEKQVGSPWDEVWSDICANTTGLMGDHVKEHAINYVVVYVKRTDDGELISGDYTYSSHGWFKIGSGELYVDPDTDILCKTAEKKRYKFGKNKRKSKIIRINEQQYFQHQGIWYRVKTKPVEEVKAISSRFRSFWPTDVFGNHLADYDIWRFYGEDVFCIWKQAANKKEIKLLNKIT